MVVFAFSKKKCEEYADTLTNTDLCVAKEKSEVHIVIERSITRLKGSDKKLPQILKMRQLLSRGIGVHHGGLLPIVKEVSVSIRDENWKTLIQICRALYRWSSCFSLADW